ELREAARREPREAARISHTSEGESPITVEPVPPKKCGHRRRPSHGLDRIPHNFANMPDVNHSDVSIGHPSAGRRTDELTRRNSTQETWILEALAKDGCRVHAQPLVQNRRINRSEIHSKLHVARSIQVDRIDRRLAADDPALYRVTDDKQRGGGAVIGPKGRVFIDAPPKL